MFVVHRKKESSTHHHHLLAGCLTEGLGPAGLPGIPLLDEVLVALGAAEVEHLQCQYNTIVQHIGEQSDTFPQLIRQETIGAQWHCTIGPIHN